MSWVTRGSTGTKAEPASNKGTFGGHECVRTAAAENSPLTFTCSDKVLQPLDFGGKGFGEDIPYATSEEGSRATAVKVVESLDEVILYGLINRGFKGQGQFGRGGMLGGVTVGPHGMRKIPHLVNETG